MEPIRDPLRLFSLARNHPYKMAMLSGLLLATSFPPSPLSFLAYVGFIPLLLVVDAYHIRWLRYTYTAFLIWNLGGCYWLMLTAMGAHNTSEAIQSLVAGLLANIANPFLMAIPVWIYVRLRTRGLPWGIAPIWAFVPLWVTFEWLHFNWDLTWSWLTLGQSQTLYPFWIQYAEFTGVFGISAVLLLGNVAGYRMLYHLREGKRILPEIGLLAVLVIFAALSGVLLLRPGREVFKPSGTLRVRVVQPNIDPYSKFEDLTRNEQITRFVELASAPGIDTIDLVILPETALPRAIFGECLATNGLIQPLWKVVRADSISLMTGFSELRYFAKDARHLPASVRPYDAEYNPSFDACRDFPSGWFDACNAAAMLRYDAAPQTAEKAKLVPLVERVPFLESLTFLKDFNIDLGGNFGNYGLPDSLHALQTHTGARVGSLVCYESQFGGHVRQLVKKRADVLAIITNDGWWGRSSGHIQHAHFTTLRAIETRREVARSANTGISLFADAKGYLHQQTPWWQPAFADRAMHLHTAQTFYVRYGDIVGWLAGFFAIGLILVAFGRKKNPVETVTP